MQPDISVVVWAAIAVFGSLLIAIYLAVRPPAWRRDPDGSLPPGESEQIRQALQTKPALDPETDIYYPIDDHH